MFTYDVYEPGKVYGTDSFVFDEAMLGKWKRVYPDDDGGGRMPAGMIALIQQQAYKAVITPRPPGHIQGGQRFQIYGLPPVGTTITTSVSCISKEIRKERRWVAMGFLAVGSDGREIFQAVNNVITPY